MTSRRDSAGIWRLEFGARPSNDGVLFRVWAPLASSVAVRVVRPSERMVQMKRDADGVFTAFADGLSPGADYYYEVGQTRRRPDPVSRFQPNGVHEASRVVAPD